MPNSKDEFIFYLAEAITGELTTHLEYTGDDLTDLIKSQPIIRHMIITMCGSLTREVLK